MIDYGALKTPGVYLPDMSKREFNVTQVAIPEDGRQTVFVIKMPYQATTDMVNTVAAQWKALWPDNTPRLWIIENDMELLALTDVELTAVGLMRIPAIP